MSPETLTLIAQQRHAQGLPPNVEDLTALRRLAAMLVNIRHNRSEEADEE